MPIVFDPKEPLTHIAKIIAACIAKETGFPQDTAEKCGDFLNSVLGGISFRPPARSVYAQLKNLIQSALDHLHCSSEFELPEDCREPLTDTFSVENVLHYLQSADPLSAFQEAIRSTCLKSSLCDINTLPLKQITEEMYMQIYRGIINNRDLTGLITLELTGNLNRLLWSRNPALPPLRSEPEAPLPDTRSPMEHLEEAFRKYLDEQFEAYRKRNIEVATPQLLSMALRYPENRALDILNFFDAGGKNSGPYGDRLMKFLESVDEYYRRKGRAYDEAQYIAFQERLRTWIGKIEPGPGPIPANTFTWFLLRFSDGQTGQRIKQELGSSYDTALSFIRDDRLPSFPASFP